MTNLSKLKQKTKLTDGEFDGLFSQIEQIVEKGVNDANSKFNNEQDQFNFRGARAIYTTSSIKKHFIWAIADNPELGKLVRHVKSHGVDYFAIKGEFLLCFKKMDARGRVSSFYSKRFQETIHGGKVHYSVKMMEVLSKMGIKKPLPIFFCGHVLSTFGALENIFLVIYEQGSVSNILSLMDEYKANLFNIAIDNKELSEISDMVTLKNKSKSRKTAN